MDGKDVEDISYVEDTCLDMFLDDGNIVFSIDESSKDDEMFDDGCIVFSIMGSDHDNDSICFGYSMDFDDDDLLIDIFHNHKLWDIPKAKSNDASRWHIKLD